VLERVVVVGASLAGLRAVEALRRDGFEGRLTLVGAEDHLPYDRPPLSKEFLAGTKDRAAIDLRTEPLDALAVDVRLGAPAHDLDLDGRTVAVRDDVIGFDGLVIATGAHPRALPGQPDLDGVLALRTVDDAQRIRAAFDRGDRLCVIGAGFIGAEVAATARTQGHDVTVLEALDQPMVRGVGEEIGAVLARLHRAHDVDLRLGVGVGGIAGTGRVERVDLADGTAVDCDAVLVAIGVVPSTGWLEGSGLTLDDGVVCDATLHAAPDVVVAGDACRWPNPRFDDEVMRIEHWTNAAEQGVHAARALLAGADAAPFDPVPYVWSDQYHVKIQCAGRFGGDDRMEVVHGSTDDDDHFVAIWERGGRVSGVLGLSEPRRVVQLRKLIADRASFDAALAFAAEHP
jgi:NADPH-dependent 2,4-dienoyl-CoA reductase/sulfur reductase-like enzyme